jgi:hypothetical protein
MGQTAPERAPGPYDTRRADRRDEGAADEGAADGVADDLIRQAPHRPASGARLTPVPPGRGREVGGHGGA